jgi:hypothetical protein
VTEAARALQATVTAGPLMLVLALTAFSLICALIAVAIAFFVGWRPGRGDYPHEHGDGEGR